MRVSKPPQERRAELMAAARLLFDQKGVEKTRISDIVARVRVAQGVLYYYFDSKEAMVEAVARQVAGEVEVRTGQILADEGMDLARKLAMLIELVLDIVDQFTGDDITRLPPLHDVNSYSMPGLQGFGLVKQAMHSLVERAAEGGELKLRYPQQTVDMLIYGLWGLARQQLPGRDVIYALAERGLGLPEGSMAQYMPKKMKEKRGVKKK